MKSLLLALTASLSFLGIVQEAVAASLQLPPDARAALEYFLKVDCQVEEKRKPLSDLLKFKSTLQSSVENFSQTDFTNLFYSETETIAGKNVRPALEWEWRQIEAFVKETTELGHSNDLTVFQNESRETYIARREQEIKHKYRERLVFAITTIALETSSAPILRAIEKAGEQDAEINRVIERARQFTGRRQ